jgi:hypothetical protein
MATKDISDLQCCQAAANAGLAHTSTGRYLMQMTGQPEKVCYRAIERAISRGYLECGVGTWRAWLEPKGRCLLEQSKLEAKDAPETP